MNTGLTWARRRERGVTIVEMMVAMGVLVLFSSVSFWALLTLNRQAMASRLFTGALAAAQSQMDSIQNMPTNKMSGTYTANNTVWPSVLNATGTSTPSVVTIYADPQVVVSGSIPPTITGTLSTVIINTGTIAVSNTYWNYFSVQVSVNYTYANNPYSVVLNTIRSNAP